MNFFYNVILLCFVFVSGEILLPYDEYVEGQRIYYMADGNDNLYVIDLEQEVDTEPRFDAFKDTLLKLYTRDNPKIPHIIGNGDLSEFHNSNLNFENPIKIVIHGWRSNWETPINEYITEAYLENHDLNVIFVDWSGIASSLNYVRVVRNVPRVGEFVAYLVDWLVENKADLNKIHIMGHSLGAHVAGIAGRNIKSGKVPYILGFDPALPLWGAESERINKTDAAYVEIIHTNGKFLGIMEAIGHNDFYPNGGKYQPGCSINIACSHSRSYQFFADSIDHDGFMATQCNSVSEAESGKCSGPQMQMGTSKPKPAMGIFHLITNSERPYYKG